MRPFKPSYIIEVFPELLPYTWVTLGIMVVTVIFGSILGFVLAFCKLKGGKIGNAFASAYIYIARCVPPIIMLFIVYYGLPELLLGFGININNADNAVFVLIAFTLLFASNMAEVFRSSYLAIEKGQREAGLCAGLSEFQTFRRIVFPQATVVALPNFTNALVNLMKEGSLAYTIGLMDLMGRGIWKIGQNQGSYNLEIYLAMAIVYWCLTLLIEKLFGRIELYLSKGKKILT